MTNAAHWRGLCAGLAASVSIALGYFPVAFSFGVSALEWGLAPSVAVLASVIVFAGASQFLLVALLASGAGVWTVAAGVWLMNARHALYGPAVATQLGDAHKSPQQRLPSAALAFGLTDEVFATAMGRLGGVPVGERDGWLLGAGLGAYAAWVGGTVAGVMLAAGARAWPAAVREALGFVLPALFFALILEMGPRRWRVPLGVAAAVALALVFSGAMPAHLALLAAMVAGSVAQAAFGKPSDGENSSNHQGDSA